MADINKYFQDQSSKLNTKFKGKTEPKPTKIKHVNEKNEHALVDSESGSEYLPSDDEAEEVTILPIEGMRRKGKQHLKKIFDDGDKNIYKTRLDDWKSKVNEVKAGHVFLNEDEVNTADVQYALLGHTDGSQLHEIDGGLAVPKYIWKQLYKYQKTGVKWLWELHQVESGGLLGDEMGLGKTVQIIAFLAGLSKTNSGPWNGLGPSIIVAPATVIYQWVSHFHYWSPHLRVAVLHTSGTFTGRKTALIKEIFDNHGILIVSYAGIVKYQLDLLNRKWHYLILDEGHKIRNPEAQVSKVVKKINTPHRILITGSPMQNNLQELWSLFDFMRPGLLGSLQAFQEFFANPITQGGYANASQLQEATALEIAKSLKNMIMPYLIRRTKAQVQEHIHLPEKNEQVLFCALTVEQRELYMGYLLSGTVRSILDKENKYGEPMRAKILIAIMALKKICNHPDLFIYDTPEDDDANIDFDNFGHWKRSGKHIVVQSLLKIWSRQGHRALIFTQSRAMLCILEGFLQKNNYTYLKMDGSVSVGARQNIIKTFNEDSSYLVFLATTRVGGLGVNLTGADRVIIYDPDWNPATDSQAKERAWRIGQTRNVTVYRLLSAGTIEEKIYQRQVFKHFLSNKILLDPNQKNLLKTSTLQGLFTLEDPNKEGDTETSTIFCHTKVKTSRMKNVVPDSKPKSSLSRIEAMRKKAKEISAKIGAQYSSNPQQEDPREKYKKKRETVLCPPIEEKPEINLVDDNVTAMSFESALTELDIINKHSKENYVENLIKKTIDENKSEDFREANETEGENKRDDLEETNEIEGKSKAQSGECSTNSEGKPIKCDNTNDKAKMNIITKRKSSDCEIENLVAVKKVKKKKSERNENLNDDDYVLTKLFEKSCLQSALEHDKIVGLNEKEELLKVKEEAAKRAKFALRALRKSRKK